MSNAARSYEVFFDEHCEHVRRALAVAFADPVLAEDSARDAFARAFVHWRTVSVLERPAGWVYVVALGAAVERDELDELLRRLPERQRIAVVLRYLADLPIADVAAAMGCAVGTVKSTLHAALTRPRVELHDRDEESWSDARG